ncbi:MAG: hypothetical protein AB1772_11465 [Candidatus Zixiibacteriota bacterium]
MFRDNLTQARVASPARVTALLLLMVAILPDSGRAGTALRVTVDARELPRKLLYSTTELEAGRGSVPLLYPKWVPGCHTPGGPIENVAGFVVRDQSNNPVAWERDWSDQYRFVTKSNARQKLRVDMTYICSQPTTMSWASDCEGRATFGVINWNAVTVYPEGEPVAGILVHPILILPNTWRFATALPVDHINRDTVVFQHVSYEELLDCPVICGLHMNSYDLAPTSMARYSFHVVVDDEMLLRHADSAFAGSAQVKWQSLIAETEALFGKTPFRDYRFLIAVSDSIMTYGIEHRTSSYNSSSTAALYGSGQSDFWFQWLLPHEFAHAWVGKYRSPRGMAVPDFHTPLQLDLLWVYEGLDEYLGNILAVRSGLVSPQRYKQEQALEWTNLINTSGRNWRSLRDVAVSTPTFWHNSRSWALLRRGADYYEEGAMLWLEIDCRLRELTNGEASLDTYCRSFLGPGSRNAASFDRKEIVSTLNALAAFSWDSLITNRIDKLSDTLNHTALAASGYQINYTDEKPQVLAETEGANGAHIYDASLGLTITDYLAQVDQIVPGSPADKAGLVTGMSIIGVNGKTFSFERFEKAISDAVTTGELRLLTQRGEILREYTIRYDGGPRYLKLEPIDGRTHWLDSILAPRVDTSSGDPDS